jgi:hypothetical protein
MTPTQKRLAALEARTMASQNDAIQAEHGRAWKSLFAVLHAALPTVYPVGIPKNGRQYAEAIIDFEAHILRLDERITAGAMTVADAALLATLPAADLLTCKLTAECVINALARVLRKY